MTEAPQAREIIHRMIPEWGTQNPLSLNSATGIRIYDSSLRPAAEDSYGRSPAPNPGNVPNEFRPVRFQDYRKGGMTNMSAYRAVAADYDDTFALMGALRARIHPYDTPMDLWKLNEVVTSLVMFPNWLVLRSDNPMKNGEVPIAIAGIVRIGRGQEGLMGDLGADPRLRRYTKVKEVPGGEISPESLLQSLFENHQLHTLPADGDRDTIPDTKDLVVCAAPPDILLRSLRVLFEKPEGSDSILKKFGIELSTDDISRIKKLGQARQAKLTSLVALPVIESKLTQNMETHSKALMEAVAKGIRINHTGFVLGRVKLYNEADDIRRRLNSAQNLVSQSLKRKKAPPITLDDLGIYKQS